MTHYFFYSNGALFSCKCYFIQSKFNLKNITEDSLKFHFLAWNFVEKKETHYILCMLAIFHYVSFDKDLKNFYISIRESRFLKWTLFIGVAWATLRCGALHIEMCTSLMLQVARKPKSISLVTTPTSLDRALFRILMHAVTLVIDISHRVWRHIVYLEGDHSSRLSLSSYGDLPADLAKLIPVSRK